METKTSGRSPTNRSEVRWSAVRDLKFKEICGDQRRKIVQHCYNNHQYYEETEIILQAIQSESNGVNGNEIITIHVDIYHLKILKSILQQEKTI